MYKSLIITVSLCFSLTVNAQIDTAKKNELHLNILTSLSHGFVEASYERVVTENSAIGISGFVPVINHKTYAFGVIPYYRQFLGKKIASGFFVEGSLAMLSRKDNYELVSDDYGGYSTLLTNGLNYGYGVAIGTKLKSRNNFVVNIYGGVVRLLKSNGDHVFPRVGITVGKRF